MRVRSSEERSATAPKTAPGADRCPTKWGHREPPTLVPQTGDITSLTTPMECDERRVDRITEGKS